MAAGLLSNVAANHYSRNEASASRRRSAYSDFILGAGALVWLLKTLCRRTQKQLRLYATATAKAGYEPIRLAIHDLGRVTASR
jgi:hypothetical protein